jgi:CMP-2-keto-3-deoxyoctulosonic acid synthetase
VGRVVVATDAEAIVAAVREAGGEAVMTRADHVSGSDRVFEAVTKVDPRGAFEVILNLQGDLPAMQPTASRRSSRRGPTSPPSPPRSPMRRTAPTPTR